MPGGPSKSVSIRVHLWFLHAEPAGRHLPFVVRHVCMSAALRHTREYVEG